MQPHLDLACAKLNNTQEELKISQDTTSNLALRVTELENQLELFQTTLNSLSLRIDDVNALENKVDTFQTQFGNVEGKVDDVKDRVETLEMILKDVVESKKVDALENKVDTFQTQFGNVEGKVDDLNGRVELLMAILKYSVFPKIQDEEFPPYIWTVTNFWEKVSRAKNGQEFKIESDSFYVGPRLHGYKMKLSMYPNGSAGNENTYMSLYSVLMKGQYDAIVHWPFWYNSRFTVIDQNPDLKQRQNYSLSFYPGPKWTIIRPKCEENGGWGFGEFLSHEKLRKSFYVVDGTLFIKFEVSRCENV